jgi:hypothetical protein
VRNPRYFNPTIAAGGIARISAHGNYVLVLTISASTIAMGIDDDLPQQVCPGLRIPLEKPCERIQLINIGAVASVVELLVSDTPIDLATTAAILAALIGPTTATYYDELDVDAAPAAAVLVMAANTGRSCCAVQAKISNGGIIYIGYDNLVTTTHWNLNLEGGQGYTWDDYRGDIWAIASINNQMLGRGEW